MFISPSRGMRGLGAFLVFTAAFGAAGCGAATGAVSGKVSYKDKLLKGGNVTFVSLEGKPSASTSIKEDGTYSIPNAPTGKVKICVETESLNPAGKIKAPRYSPPPGAQAPAGFDTGDPADMAKRFVAIPGRYANPDTTDLAYEVKGGSAEYNIELK